MEELAGRCGEAWAITAGAVCSGDDIWPLPGGIGMLHSRPKHKEKPSQKGRKLAARNRQDRKQKPATMMGEELDPSGDDCPQIV